MKVILSRKGFDSGYGGFVIWHRGENGRAVSFLRSAHGRSLGSCRPVFPWLSGQLPEHGHSKCPQRVDTGRDPARECLRWKQTTDSCPQGLSLGCGGSTRILATSVPGDVSLELWDEDDSMNDERRRVSDAWREHILEALGRSTRKHRRGISQGHAARRCVSHVSDRCGRSGSR